MWAASEPAPTMILGFGIGVASGVDVERSSYARNRYARRASSAAS